MARIILIALMLFPLALSAQVGFSYDDAGNRTSRFIITPQSKSTEEIFASKTEEYLLENELKLLLFPNPTSGILVFQVENKDDAGLININVFDISGSLLIKESHLESSFTIDISDKPNGTYLMDIIINNKKYLFKVVKQ